MTYSRQVRRNILAKRLPEICDVPHRHKLSIFGRASMLGEEDVATRPNYSCSLKCYSFKGTLYELKKEYFNLLKQSEPSWHAIVDKIIQKERLVKATNLKGIPRDFEKEDE